MDTQTFQMQRKEQVVVEEIDSNSAGNRTKQLFLSRGFRKAMQSAVMPLIGKFVKKL